MRLNSSPDAKQVQIMQTHIATRKTHWCFQCQRRIPIGARYFYTGEYSIGGAEHTNCEEYANEPRYKSRDDMRKQEKSASPDPIGD